MTKVDNARSIRYIRILHLDRVYLESKDISLVELAAEAEEACALAIVLW